MEHGHGPTETNAQGSEGEEGLAMGAFDNGTDSTGGERGEGKKVEEGARERRRGTRGK